MAGCRPPKAMKVGASSEFQSRDRKGAWVSPLAWQDGRGIARSKQSTCASDSSEVPMASCRPPKAMKIGASSLLQSHDRQGVVYE